VVQHQFQKSEEEKGLEVQYESPNQSPVKTAQLPAPVPRSAYAKKVEPTVLASRHTSIPVLLIATEAAHQIAWKNKLRLQDMFQGLVQSMISGYANIKPTATSSTPRLAPFRSANNFIELKWSDLSIDFCESIACMTDAEAASLLQKEATLQDSDGNVEGEMYVMEDQVDNLLQPVPPQPKDASARRDAQQQVLKDAFELTSPQNIPWLLRYRQALDESTNYMDHELFHCPVLALVVCSTAEPAGLLETVTGLMSSTSYYLPETFRNGLMDPSRLERQVLVLHDNCQGPTSPDVGGVQRQFPLTTVLNINSIATETAARLASEETRDLWGGGGQLGTCLSTNDRSLIRKYMAHMITSFLLPALERRVARLNAIVSERKKGVKNAILGLWRTGKTEESKSGGTPGNPAVPYRYDSIENQTRLLADTMLALKDYEEAFATYRLIKDDFKQDRRYLQHGSVHELMALCLYNIDAYGRAGEIFISIEQALLGYSRAGEVERSKISGKIVAAPKATRLATRLCLVLTGAHEVCETRHLEAADLLASASSNETSLGAAVLLEQASASYFRASHYRKYAFHMLMSGHMFRTAEQHPHAFRCFASALHIYRDSKWEELHNHLRSALAAQLYTMNRMSISLQLYTKLVGASAVARVSVTSQQKFIKHLLEICNEHPKNAMAAADRLAAPSHLTGAEREKARKEKHDRIVQVVRFTKGALRVLELPHVDLPMIHDTSVHILGDEASHHRQEVVPSFGTAHRGDESVWDTLMIEATSEINASNNVPREDEVESALLSNIDDPHIRLVISEMDKEQQRRSLRAKSKRSAKYKAKPPVRAEKEPFFVEFNATNLLGAPVDITDMQLVAKMVSFDGKRVCTNEDSVKITPLESYDQKPEWKFDSASKTFVAADFCRLSSEDGENEQEKWKSTEEETPFFVVTKESLSWDPKSTQSVQLGICPLIQGKLELLGVRFRLFDNVWVFHQFRLKGALMQNTASNRANRVRAEPMLLKSIVERGMPCLTVDLLNADAEGKEETVALQGQVRPWLLRVTNIGTAPATCLTLKTNVPWVRIPDASRSDINKPTSCCVGASGTMMRLSLHGEDLKKDGELAPGESADVSIEIRTSGRGKEHFYMLFRYEVSEESSGLQPRKRWLRKMFEVPVYPSLTFAARLSTSAISRHEHILSIRLTNSRNDNPDDVGLQLSSMKVANWRYELQPIEGQLLGEVAHLGWQESLSMHYRVVVRSEESSLLSSCEYETGSEEVDNVTDLSPLAIPCMERAHQIFEDQLVAHKIALAEAVAAQNSEKQHPRSIAQIRRANTSKAGDETYLEQYYKSHPTSVARLCPKDRNLETLQLICQWKGRDIRGQHHIRDLVVRQSENKIGACPIVLSADFPSEVKRDFSLGPAVIPFTVHAQNRLTKEKVGFRLDWEPHPRWDLTGAEDYSSELDGGEMASFRMKAMMHRTGVYDLQALRLTTSTGGSFVFPSQWLISVSAE